MTTRKPDERLDRRFIHEGGLSGKWSKWSGNEHDDHDDQQRIHHERA